MPKLNLPLSGNPILSHTFILGFIITLITTPIHSPSGDTIVFTTPIVIVRGSKWLCLFCADFVGNCYLEILWRKGFCLDGWKDEVKSGPLSNL